MAVLITTIVIGVLILIAGIITGIVIMSNGDGGKGFLVACATPVACICLLFGSFRSVGANQVGIIYDDRYGVVEKTYGEGFGTKSIFEHITTISTTNRTAKVTTTGQTNDGQFATFELSLIYKIEKDNAGKFYKVTGSDDIGVEDLDSIVKKCLQSSTINYNIFELLSEGLETARIDFQTDLATNLTNEYYTTLVQVSFDDIDAGDDVEAILQRKAEADQEIEIARKQAEAALITAQNEAEVTKTLADAEAYATQVKGQAEGEAASAYIDEIMAMIDNLYTNMAGTMSYSECANLVLSIIFYNTWNGELPTTLTSDELSGLIGGLLTTSTSSETDGSGTGE